MADTKAVCGFVQQLHISMLDQRRAQEKGYITLKEAAELCGYSSDYIGQLIRKGKIDGQQVYANVAWVTTEEAVRGYLESRNKTVVDKQLAADGNLSEMFQDFGVYILRILIAVLACATLVLFYVFSVSVDKKVSERYEPAPVTDVVSTDVRQDYVFVYE